MSKSSSKLDLLVRVRFENPLPEPPFPPKLLSVSTDIQRLGEPSYLNQLASTLPHPMLVDSEMGMPIDLNAFEGVWDGDDGALNPSTDPNRVDHPEDQILLGPLNLLANANGAPSAATSKPVVKPEVSWMRSSTYIQKRETTVRRREEQMQQNEDVDASEAAQLTVIEQTFKDVHSQDLKDMRHPDAKRKHLRVVESYDILPDDETWANSYIMIKFPERPSAATRQDTSVTASSERLSRAVLRPIMEDDQQIMEFFLPKEDDLGRIKSEYEHPMDGDAVTKLLDTINGGRPDEEIDAVFPNVHYDRIRTYEVSTQTAPHKEFLLTFCEEPAEEEEDDDDMFGDEEPARKKRKGAYFKEITMRTNLTKTRAKKSGEDEGRTDLWDKVRVGFREPWSEEAELRATALASVTEPTWVDQQLRSLRGEDDDPSNRISYEDVQSDEEEIIGEVEVEADAP